MAITFGAVPHTDDETTRVLLADFCDVLSSRAGIAVAPHRSPSPKALASAFQRGRVDIAWTSPILFVTSAAFVDCVPLVSTVRQGEATYSGVLYVPADSPLRHVEQLRGSRVAWVARTSAAGYVMPRLALHDAGIDTAGFFGEETFGDTHGEVVRRVRAGEADVGATYAVIRPSDDGPEIVQAAFDAADAHVLLVSRPIPSDLMVVQARVPELARTRLTNALLGDDPRLARLCAALFDAQGYRPFEAGPFEALKRELECCEPIPWSQSA